MNKDEMMIDRYYDDMYAHYMTRTKVPMEDLEEIEEKYEHLRCQMKDVIDYIRNNDIDGAYEYIVSEGLNDI